MVKQNIPIYNVPSTGEGYSDEFDIKRLSYGHDRYEKTTAPHRHDHYTLIILCQGTTRQFIDFKEYEAKDAALLFMRPGQVHYEVDPGNAEMYLVTFKGDFLFSYSADNHWEQQFSSNLLSLKKHELERILAFVALIEEEYTLFKQNRAVVAQLLLALLEKTESYVSPHTHITGRKRYSTLMRQFIALVEKDFLSHTKVADYASKLFISAGHLNDVVKEMTGTNAKTVIDERRVLEAKRLLFWTQLPIREVGWKIGFEDPAYFTRFFKKHTGKLPASFQRDLQKKIHH
ncbi:MULTISPECIES: helix-turn-helix domain-containing protein [Olivibacter]|uniref:Transcriptional regulator, AraC family n=3 Tax=Sphingobacteriaceae TaxID=84566 RepID=F4C2A5_SPHS2|nr:MULTISPECIES: helix-turn-helix domain-containing protein [Olivibacter]MCL4640986.1 helix-turn-helix domain-containing protein [Olivibacter sp. UJ_SKK_5.1]MDM8175296.1 helix-turn-helix domain-containing protein [Olivibacter sp. 47]MDX3913025.1 helix-turn-helix domain-containing protein [Pseudosphingobacterium sp.]QEL02062.1 helix-turn-helix domain-containing protein [Olivibacter sp. LS-1]